jgi:hypothetical protein
VASKKPRRVKPAAGEPWWIRRTHLGDELAVLVLEVGPMLDKGAREVTCLVLEAIGSEERPGSVVTLTNGAFCAPNRRIA